MTKTFFLNSTLADYGEEEFNYIQKFLLQQGILNTEGADYNDFIDLQVSQHSAGDMSVDVAVGVAVINTLRSGVSFKVFASNQAVENLVVGNNTSGSNRVDAVILKLSRTVEPNALMNNVATLEIVAGSGVSALSDGAIQTAIGTDYDFIRLADITVANGDTEILTADIADTRVRCYSTDTTVPNPTIIKFRQLTADPTTPAEGEMWYNTTDNILRYFDGSVIINIQASVYTGGNGIDVTAGIITVNLDTASGLAFNGGKLRIDKNYYGDGADGDVVISSNTNLARDMYYNNLTINSGITLDPKGYKIYVKETLLNNGIITRVANNGTNGQNYTTGASTVGGGGGVKLSDGTLSGGISGGNGGGASNTTATAGTVGANATCLGIDGKAGGTGGNGQTNNGAVGGVGGTATLEYLTFSEQMLGVAEGINTVFNYLAKPVGSTNSLLSTSAGAGGGGGGGSWNGATYVGASGGGGGASGAVIFICAFTLTNNGTISANGGNGGNGGNGYGNHTTGSGGGGGGAGGNGGTIILVYRTITVGTITVSGGTGGTGGTGMNYGTNGTDGGLGKIFRVII